MTLREVRTRAGWPFQVQGSWPAASTDATSSRQAALVGEAWSGRRRAPDLRDLWAAVEARRPEGTAMGRWYSSGGGGANPHDLRGSPGHAAPVLL